MNTCLKLFFPLSLLLSCHSQTQDFIKTTSGMEYRIIKEGSGDIPKNGQFIKMQVKQYYNDSLLSDTRKTLPQYQVFDSTQLSKEAYSIFSQVHTSDSLIFRVPADTAFKMSRPKFVNKKGWLITYVSIEAILSPQEAKADYDLEKARLSPSHAPTPSYNMSDSTGQTTR